MRALRERGGKREREKEEREREREDTIHIGHAAFWNCKPLSGIEEYEHVRFTMHTS
jgi:hypothetical protein